MRINVYRSELGPGAGAERAAYDYLRTRILSGQIPGGASLSQQQIADDLGISRIPVRDAIKHLSAEGLVTIESNRRAIVAAMTMPEVRESYLMSSVLEGLAAREAAPRMTPEVLAQLATCERRMALPDISVDEYLASHEEFHALIAAQSGMPRLERQIRVMRAASQPFLRAYMLQFGVGDKGVKHRPLLQALKRRDGEAAERAVIEHIEGAWEVMMERSAKAK